MHHQELKLPVQPETKQGEKILRETESTIKEYTPETAQSQEITTNIGVKQGKKGLPTPEGWSEHERRPCATNARLFIQACGAAQEMRVGPSKPACRSRFQTTVSCAGQEPGW